MVVSIASNVSQLYVAVYCPYNSTMINMTIVDLIIMNSKTTCECILNCPLKLKVISL